MRRKIRRAVKIERRVEDFISYFLALALVCLSTLNVILRYFFNAPIQWTEEILVAAFMWVTFWSMGLCYRCDNFIHVDFIDSYVGPKVRKTLAYLVDICLFLFSFVVLYWALKLSILGRAKLTNILHIPYSYIYISLFLGFLSVDKEIIIKYTKLEIF